jgi:acyl carrier protein
MTDRIVVELIAVSLCLLSEEFYMSSQNLSELLALVLDVAPDRVTATTVREDLEEWDSLAQLSVVSALEESYSVLLSTEQMNRCVSVTSIVNVLSEHGVDVGSYG